MTSLVDLGGGPGWYAARLLDGCPGAVGLTLDSSSYAARAAARAHPRLASVVADTWSTLPLRSGAFDVVTCVFAPRNSPEFGRILAPDGLLLVVSPEPDHLCEVREPLALTAVAEDKQTRLAEQLATSGLRVIGSIVVRRSMTLTHQDLLHLALMGPTAFHADEATMRERIAQLPSAYDVTCAVSVLDVRPARAGPRA